MSKTVSNLLGITVALACLIVIPAEVAGLIERYSAARKATPAVLQQYKNSISSEKQPTILLINFPTSEAFKQEVSIKLEEILALREKHLTSRPATDDL